MTPQPAEQALIGMLVQTHRSMDDALASGLTPHCFADQDLGYIFDKLLALDNKNAIWDPQMVQAMVEVDLAVRIAELCDLAPLTQNVRYFADEVVNAAWTRKAAADYISMYRRLMARQPFEDCSSTKTEMDRMHTDLMAEATGGALATPSAADMAVKIAVEYDENRIDRAAGKPTGLTSGFPTLDLGIGYLRPRGLYLIAARTGVGKTTLAGNMIEAATASGAHGVYFTIEMADTQIAARILSAAARVPANMLDGDLTNEQQERLLFQLRKFGEGTLTINDRAGRTLEGFEMECRRLHRMKMLDIAVIDYVQLMNIVSKNYPHKTAEVTEISGRLKKLALELKIPIIALAQINRDATKNSDKIPTIAQIKDSGALEQDADGIFILHREDTGADDDRTFLIVAKNRHGISGNVELEKDLACSRFRDLHA